MVVWEDGGGDSASYPMPILPARLDRALVPSVVKDKSAF